MLRKMCLAVAALAAFGVVSAGMVDNADARWGGRGRGYYSYGWRDYYGGPRVYSYGPRYRTYYGGPYYGRGFYSSPRYYDYGPRYYGSPRVGYWERGFYGEPGIRFGVRF